MYETTISTIVFIRTHVFLSLCKSCFIAKTKHSRVIELYLISYSIFFFFLTEDSKKVKFREWYLNF